MPLKRRRRKWTRSFPELWCWLVIAICAFLVLRALLFGIRPNFPLGL